MSSEASRFGFNYHPRSRELSFCHFLQTNKQNKHVRVKGGSLKESCKKSFFDHCILSTLCCVGRVQLLASAKALGVNRPSPSKLVAHWKMLSPCCRDPCLSTLTQYSHSSPGDTITLFLTPCSTSCSCSLVPDVLSQCCPSLLPCGQVEV